jgi:hypothetical protein
VINFDQVEPGPYPPQTIEENLHLKREMITACRYFNVERVTLKEAGAAFTGNGAGQTFEIWGTMSGRCQIEWAGQPLELPAIRFTLLPAVLGEFKVVALEPSVLLRVYVPA